MGNPGDHTLGAKARLPAAETRHKPTTREKDGTREKGGSCLLGQVGSCRGGAPVGKQYPV